MGLYSSPSLLLREASEVPFLSMLLMSWQDVLSPELSSSWEAGS